MNLSRRQFVILVSVTASGCGKTDKGPNSPPSVEKEPAPSNAVPTTAPDQSVIDAGPIIAFPSDGVYGSFREQGVFVIRRKGQLFAMSSICTHKGCKVRAKENQSFLCKCHGSTFDPEGKVLTGPAKRNLPRLAVLTQNSHLLVNLDLPLPSAALPHSSIGPIAPSGKHKPIQPDR